MKNRIERLSEAQRNAMAVRPKVGGFPVLAEVLRQAGVISNRWSLPACQSVYVMDEGAVVQQGTPLVTGTHDVPKFDKEALITALRADQAGQSTFPEFLLATWRAGIVGYEVDFLSRKVTYFGADGETYTEAYSAVDVPVRPPAPA